MTERIEVRDPRTQAVERVIDAASPEQIAALADRLREGQAPWARRSARERAAVLLRWRERITGDGELVRALSADTGRGRESALELELVGRSLDRWAAFAETLDVEEPPRRSASVSTVDIQARRVPHRLVGVVSPWNFPLLLAMIDTIPALLAGCAVLCKPSEVTPRFVEPLRRSIDAIPELAEVLQCVLGGATTGRALVDSVDAVCFTGSTTTGREVARRCAERLIPAFLELGGKDPAIVLRGADLERAATAVAWAGCVNAGQSCLSIERVYVERSVFDAYVERLCRAVARLRLAHPNPEDGEIGPLIAARQAEVIRRQLDDAFARGARALVGGRLRELDGGLYCEPTVLVDVDHDMLVMREETFGPILPVMAVDDADDAVRRANECAYGLSGAVFGPPELALAVAERLDCGAVSIGDAGLTAVVHDAEKQSFGASGLGGTRMGPRSIERFHRRKALLVHDRPEPDPWWFPTSVQK